MGSVIRGLTDTLGITSSRRTPPPLQLPAFDAAAFAQAQARLREAEVEAEKLRGQMGERVARDQEEADKRQAAFDAEEETRRRAIALRQRGRHLLLASQDERGVFAPLKDTLGG